MRIEESNTINNNGTVINVMFDAAKGSVSILSREAVSGAPLGTLPRPSRSGYTFEGWYLGEELVTEATVLNTDEDVRLVAHWAKKKGSQKASMLKKQKIAIAVLAAVVVLLTATLLVVNQIVTIYPLVDTYYKDGVEYNDTYYVKKKDGVYGMYDKKGNLMEVNDDGYYIASVSGNQYSVDAETGDFERYAVVDYDSEGGELLGFSDRIMMFPQITQKNTYSIEVTNEYGSFRFYRDENGNVHIEGTEDSLVSYDQTLFASLCVSCGYTLTMQKLNLSPDYVAPRLEDGSVDYSAYGLADLYDGEGNLIYTPATYTVTKAIYAEDGTCTADPDTKYTVKVGDAILSGGGYYVQLVGRDAVYIVSSDIQSTVLQPVESLVTPSVVYPMGMSTYMMIQNFVLGEIDLTGVWDSDEYDADEWEEIFGDSKPLVAFTYLDLEDRTNTIYTSRPYQCGIELMNGYEINDDNASGVMSLFYEMEYIACKKLGITKAALKDYELDGNAYYLTFASPVLDDNNSIIGYIDNFLMISQKTPDGTYYIASTLTDMIVEVDQYYLSFLEWEESDWYDQYFFQHNISYISSMGLKIWDAETQSYKSFDFTLDNSASYMFYEVDGSMKQIDLSKGSISTDADGNVTYTLNGVKYGVTSFDFTNGSYYLKIVDSNTGKVTYEPFYKYLITVDRDGNRNLRVIQKGDGENEVSVDYPLTYKQNGSLKVGKTYSLVYRDGNGAYYSVLGTYSSSDGTSYQDYYHLSYWQEVQSTTESGASTYVWERVAPINTSSNLNLKDESGKTYSISLGSTNLRVYCEQYQNGTADPNLLDYTIVYTYTTDSGKEKTKTISGVDNFRKLYSDLMWYSIEGDVDPEEFEKNMGMSMDDYIKQGDGVCQAIFTYRVADMADTMNLQTYVGSNDDKSPEIKNWVENNEMDVVVRFYRYSERKSMITIEVIEEYDENGNPISNPENAAGRFYVLSTFLDQLLGDAERLIAEERVEQD